MGPAKDTTGGAGGGYAATGAGGGDAGGGEASAPVGLSFWVIRETVFPFFECNIFYEHSPYLWWDGGKYVVVSQRWWQGQVRG